MPLNALGWDDGWADALAAVHEQDPALTPARVITVHRGAVVVRADDEGEDLLLPMLASVEQPLVGDWVGFRDGAIRVVLPRRSVLEREGAGLAANADRCIIISSLDGDLNLRRLERFVALVRAAGVEPLVVCSKGDRSADPDADARRVRDRTGGAEVLVISAQDGWGITALTERLAPRSTNVLVGMSGVGKSTLVNHLLGEERMAVREVRATDDRGRHTTTHRELVVLPGGALLVDTPGIRLPRMPSAEGIEDAFADIAELAAGCRFADCRHEQEPGCAVRDVVDPDRLRSLRKLEQEGQSAAERRARAREVHRGYRQIKKLKPPKRT